MTLAEHSFWDGLNLAYPGELLCMDKVIDWESTEFSVKVAITLHFPPITPALPAAVIEVNRSGNTFVVIEEHLNLTEKRAIELTAPELHSHLFGDGKDKYHLKITRLPNNNK